MQAPFFLLIAPAAVIHCPGGLQQGPAGHSPLPPHRKLAASDPRKFPSTYISSYFGLRDAPTEGASTDHAGLDFGADVGDDIVSSMDGVVIKIDYNEFRGNFIVVDVGTDKSGRSITVLYQHLSGVACNLGDKVVRGQVIGYAGETGVATGPHLHYEVRVDGDPVDPLPYLGLN